MFEATQAIDFGEYNIDTDDEETVARDKSKPVAHLHILSEDINSSNPLESSAVFPLYPGKNIIGRAEDANVRITKKSISMKHACIEIDEDDNYWLMDLGSTNKTRIVTNKGKKKKSKGPAEKILEPNKNFQIFDKTKIFLGKVATVFVEASDESEGDSNNSSNSNSKNSVKTTSAPAATAGSSSVAPTVMHEDSEEADETQLYEELDMTIGSETNPSKPNDTEATQLYGDVEPTLMYTETTTATTIKREADIGEATQMYGDTTHASPKRNAAIEATLMYTEDGTGNRATNIPATVEFEPGIEATLMYSENEGPTKQKGKAKRATFNMEATQFYSADVDVDATQTYSEEDSERQQPRQVKQEGSKELEDTQTYGEDEIAPTLEIEAEAGGKEEIQVYKDIEAENLAPQQSDMEQQQQKQSSTAEDLNIQPTVEYSETDDATQVFDNDATQAYDDVQEAEPKRVMETPVSSATKVASEDAPTPSTSIAAASVGSAATNNSTGSTPRLVLSLSLEDSPNVAAAVSPAAPGKPAQSSTTTIVKKIDFNEAAENDNSDLNSVSSDDLMEEIESDTVRAPTLAKSPNKSMAPGPVQETPLSTEAPSVAPEAPPAPSVITPAAEYEASAEAKASTDHLRTALAPAASNTVDNTDDATQAYDSGDETDIEMDDVPEKPKSKPSKSAPAVETVMQPPQAEATTSATAHPPPTPTTISPEATDAGAAAAAAARHTDHQQAKEESDDDTDIEDDDIGLNETRPMEIEATENKSTASTAVASAIQPIPQAPATETSTVIHAEIHHKTTQDTDVTQITMSAQSTQITQVTQDVAMEHSWEPKKSDQQQEQQQQRSEVQEEVITETVITETAATYVPETETERIINASEVMETDSEDESNQVLSASVALKKKSPLRKTRDLLTLEATNEVADQQETQIETSTLETPMLDTTTATTTRIGSTSEVQTVAAENGESPKQKTTRVRRKKQETASQQQSQSEEASQQTSTRTTRASTRRRTTASQQSQQSQQTEEATTKSPERSPSPKRAAASKQKGKKSSPKQEVKEEEQESTPALSTPKASSTSTTKKRKRVARPNAGASETEESEEEEEEQQKQQQQQEEVATTKSKSSKATKKTTPTKKKCRASPSASEDEAPARCSIKSPKIMFTGIVPSDAQTKMVKALGGTIVPEYKDATFVIANNVVRTVKFLCAVSKGIPIVTLKWLLDSDKAKYFVAEDGYIVKDEDKEKEFGFSLRASLERARAASARDKVFSGKRFFVTPEVKPEPKQMKDIITYGGGQVLPEAPEDADTSDTSLYIITCDEDLEYCKDNLAYIPAERFYLPELVLSGALKQELPSDPTIHRFDVTREVDTSKKNLRKKPVTASQQAKKGKK